MLWDYKQGHAGVIRLYICKGNELSQMMAFDESGSMVFHRIYKDSTEDSIVKEIAQSGADRVLYLGQHPYYALTPAAFMNSYHPEWGAPEKKLTVNAEISFSYIHELPLSYPLYRIAQPRSAVFYHYVLCHVFDSQVTVAAFSGGQLLMLNTFPAGNEAEALYFALAPLKKAGIETENARIELMAEEHLAHIHLNLFSRFCQDVAMCPLDLPYESGQFPPGADISALLYQLPQCALPEAD